MLVFGREIPALGTPLYAGSVRRALNCCCSTWQIFCRSYKDHQDHLTGLNDKVTYSGGLSGALVFWSHWDLPSWSGANAPGCMEEAQALTSAAFSFTEKTSLGWRPNRLPPLPPGHAERQEDEAVVGRSQARASTAELSQLSFMEEVENSVSVLQRLQGGQSRAELGKRH